jgi:TIGR00159 family protein
VIVVLYIEEYKERFGVGLSALNFRITDIIEILILAFLIYYCIKWIKRTRTWSVLKGISILLICVLVANILRLNTILWLTDLAFRFGITALIVVFQPELRKGLESLGKKNFMANIFPFDTSKDLKERFSDKTINELVRATFEMAKVKTGALIVIEQNILLAEYERTGIELDSLVSAQLLINIFENNTPLHDGAVIISGNRIVSATCYLPLSDNLHLSKDLGTRHRAAIGISEVTDSLTIVISEETGAVSYALEGVLTRDVDNVALKRRLIAVQRQEKEEKKFSLWKGRVKNGEKTI